MREKRFCKKLHLSHSYSRSSRRPNKLDNFPWQQGCCFLYVSRNIFTLISVSCRHLDKVCCVKHFVEIWMKFRQIVGNLWCGIAGRTCWGFKCPKRPKLWNPVYNSKCLHEFNLLKHLKGWPLFLCETWWFFKRGNWPGMGRGSTMHW